MLLNLISVHLVIFLTFLHFLQVNGNTNIHLQSGTIIAGEHNNERISSLSGRRMKQRWSTLLEQAKRGVHTVDAESNPRFNFLIILRKNSDLVGLKDRLDCKLKPIEGYAFLCYTNDNLLQLEQQIIWFAELPTYHRMDHELQMMLKTKKYAEKLHVTLATNIERLVTTASEISRYASYSRNQYVRSKSLDLLQRMEDQIRLQIGVYVSIESIHSDRLTINIHYPITEILEFHSDIFSRVVRFLIRQRFVEFVEKRMQFSINNYFASKVTQSGILTPLVNSSKNVYARGITGLGQVCHLL